MRHHPTILLCHGLKQTGCATEGWALAALVRHELPRNDMWRRRTAQEQSDNVLGKGLEAPLLVVEASYSRPARQKLVSRHAC